MPPAKALPLMLVATLLRNATATSTFDASFLGR